MEVFNIFGTKTEFDLPFYEFKWGKKIAVKKLVIEWKTSGTTVAGLISTDLIDKSPINLRQQICSFVKRHNEIITEVNFENPAFYKIQRPCMMDATITVESMFERQIPDFKRIFIQFIAE